MRQAKAVASTGTVLARLEALDHFEAGRLDEAAAEAQASLNWHRSAQERSDAWVTLARVYDAQERPTATVEAVDNARRFWPDNPRLRHFDGDERRP
jgi:cytochrome c-type biogenesis protein CcmH/NrfG